MGTCDGKVDIRPASATDARGIARVRVLTWQVAYRDILPKKFLDELSVDDGEQRWLERLREPASARRSLVAVVAGRIVGFVIAGGARDALETSSIGEVYAIYVTPDCWDRGIGRQLLTSAQRDLTERGYNEAVLWVLADNQRARSFYERAGWHADGDTKNDVFGGREVTEVRYRIALETSRADDAPA